MQGVVNCLTSQTKNPEINNSHQHHTGLLLKKKSSVGDPHGGRFFGLFICSYASFRDFNDEIINILKQYFCNRV